MKEEEFITALLSTGAAITADAILDVPVEDVGLDSLDLEIFRTILERRIGSTIDERLWRTAPTLRHVMDEI